MQDTGDGACVNSGIDVFNEFEVFNCLLVRDALSDRLHGSDLGDFGDEGQEFV